MLIMIEAHAVDAWTRLDARHTSTYGWAMIVGGFAAPAFLLLAGIALALAAGSRLRRGKTPSEVAALARRRALQIFALELATAKGYDVDQPRNLAKSVTVE